MTWPWRPAVGDMVHCHHARADGIVTKTTHDGGTIVVRVTATYGEFYKIGCEYAWLPMQVRRCADQVLN